MRRKGPWVKGTLTAVGALLALGCNNEVAQPPSEAAGSGASATTTASASSTTGSGGSGALADPDPSEVTRVARLTHDQYDSTIQDLFGITDRPAAGFAPDALNGFDFDSSINLTVDARLGPQYRAAAEELAERVTSDDEVFSRIVPCSSADAACRDQFIESFGKKAFRRPLDADEVTRFGGLFDQGPDLVASGDALRDGVRLVVEAMLQSPQFLYRTELSTEAGDNGLIALDDWEVATRLSYFVLNSMPDQALFDLAEAGSLRTSEQVKTAIDALLAQSRATGQIVSFHEQAWHFDRLSSISPDADTYPLAPDNLGALARDASARFIEDVVGAEGGFAELLTAPYAYADSSLAPLYGTSVDQGLSRVDFDPSERKGLLMQVGFLAANAHAIKTDPIHRGLFVVRDLLCRVIPDPPPGASTSEPPTTSEPIETTREEVELLTGQDACITCHQAFNPAGFAFENFDAVGQLRTMENGVVVDTSGTLAMDQGELTFTGATELVDALAESSEARGCYVGKWLQFAYGRDLSEADEPVRAELAQAPSSVHEIIASVATSLAFLNRKPNEVAP